MDVEPYPGVIGGKVALNLRLWFEMPPRRKQLYRHKIAVQRTALNIPPARRILSPA